jgi:hypothetical protein
MGAALRVEGTRDFTDLTNLAKLTCALSRTRRTPLAA